MVLHRIKSRLLNFPLENHQVVFITLYSQTNGNNQNEKGDIMNNIIKNREKVSQRIAKSLYEMGIYREPNSDNLVQFDISQKRFQRIDNNRFQNYIVSQSPSLAINISEDILNNIPVLPEVSNVYNSYVTLKDKVDFKYIEKIELLVNDKYYLDRSYLDLSKSEKELLEQLAKEHIYYCGSKFRPNKTVKSKCEGLCFVKHREGLEFDSISLYDIFGKDSLEDFDFTQWDKYLINVDMDKIRANYTLNIFIEEHNDIIKFVNKEMGL